MEIYNYYFVKELKKNGHNISLLSNHSGKFPIDIPQYKLYTRKSIIQSVKIFIHLLLHKYDIVHIPYASNSFLANPLGLFKKFFKKNNYVIYIHGGGMYEWNDPAKQALFFKKAKEIISVSDPIKKEYEKRTRRKVTTILPLIPFEKSNRNKNETRNSLGIGSDEKVLIYVGSIKPIKGSDFLVNSFLKLGKEFFRKNNLKMIFVGEGVLRHELQDLVEKDKMEKEIIFLGKKRKEEIPDYLSVANIFVFASHYEGTPLSLLEAMHNNLLVIAADVTGVNNIIKHEVNGLLYPKDDFNSFKSSIEFALSNTKECNEMIDYAKNITLRNFDFKKNLLEHLNLYNA